MQTKKILLIALGTALLLIGCGNRMAGRALSPAVPGSEEVLVRGRKLFVFPGVHAPGMYELFLLKNTAIDEGDVVLDLGTGTGVQAVFAAERAGKVVATDRAPEAVRNAEYNVRYYGLSRKIEVREGDLFASISEEEKFDVIIFAPEFPRRAPWFAKDLMDGTFTDDPRWDVILEFFSRAEGYLTENGRIYYMLSQNRNMRHIKKIVTTNGLVIKRAETVLTPKNQMLSVFEITRK